MIVWQLVRGICWLITILIACALAAITVVAVVGWILLTMIGGLVVTAVRAVLPADDD